MLQTDLYVFKYCVKLFLNISIKSQYKFHPQKIKIHHKPSVF